MKAITVFMGVSAVSNISFFFWIAVVLQTGSIGFFLVLDRCLNACSVEKIMYAKLSLEKSKVFFVLIHINLPSIFNLMSLFFFFFALYILPCVYTVTTIMFISPPFCQWPQYKM